MLGDNRDNSLDSRYWGQLDEKLIDGKAKLIYWLGVFMNFKDYIIRDPEILNGVPVIKGTPITLKTVLRHLFLGDSRETIMNKYPEITPEILKVAIAYAAGVASLGLPEEALLSDEKVSALLSSVDWKDINKV